MQDRQIYLQNNPDNHRVLNRWELENYLYDKEVLRKYCLDKDLIFSESGYDDFVKNIVNQNVKDDTSRIKNFCGINTNVDSEKFKLNLAEYIKEGMPV